MKPRIIVCGLARTGLKIFCLLETTTSTGSWRSRCTYIVVGSLQAATTLMAANIESAQTLVLAGGDDALNLAILMQARVLNPKIRIINR